jgi:hypothetical protein
MTEVTPKDVKIHLAGQGMAIKSTHVGYKRYHVIDVTIRQKHCTFLILKKTSWLGGN